MSRRETHQLSNTHKVELFDQTVNKRDQVGVRLEHQMRNGGIREFRTDLDRLEYIAKEANEYRESQEKGNRIEKVGDVDVCYARRQTPNGEGVRVYLRQFARDGSGDEQRIGADAEDIKKAIHEGQRLEGELGYGPKWHTIVDANSFTKQPDGRIQANVLKSFDSEQQAREFLGKNKGCALYSEPQRHELARGESVELWAHAKVRVDGQTNERSVENQLGRCQWSQERISENFMVARWNDVDRDPNINERTGWHGTGQAYNGDPQDFRAGPISGIHAGESDEPTWVLLRMDPNRAGVGTIEAFSKDRKEMTNELATREVREMDNQRAVTTDWEKQSFGMDRQQHTQGYSM